MEISNTALQEPSASKDGWIENRDGIRAQVIHTAFRKEKHTGFIKETHITAPSQNLGDFLGRGRCWRGTQLLHGAGIPGCQHGH